MTDRIRIHGFETSNNLKVRVALGFKGIDYDFVTIEPAERVEVVDLTGQFLTPALEHGTVRLFDSAAILRYLDANFPATPRLYGTSLKEQWEIEDHEFFARTGLAGPMMEVIHTKVGGGTVDDAMLARCTEAFTAASTKVADALADRTWLVGDSMTAADITAACVLFRVRHADLFPIPPAIASRSDWIDSVMRLDRMQQQ